MNCLLLTVILLLSSPNFVWASCATPSSYFGVLSSECTWTNSIPQTSVTFNLDTFTPTNLFSSATIVNNSSITNGSAITTIDYGGFLTLNNYGSITGPAKVMINVWGGLNLFNDTLGEIKITSPDSGNKFGIVSNSPFYGYSQSNYLPSTTLLNNGSITTDIVGTVTPNYPSLLFRNLAGGILDITNNGTISALGNTTPTDNTVLIENSNSSAGSKIVNTGTMLVDGQNSAILKNSSPDIIDGLQTQTILSSVTNIGTMSSVGGSVSAPSVGILNNGTIQALNNLQGVGNTAGALTYAGILPVNYNVIIRSPTSYGQLSVLALPSGAMAFGIYGSATGFSPITYTNSSGSTSSIAASSIATGTYNNVLQGLTGVLSQGVITGTGFTITGTSGVYGAFSYSLYADNSCTGCWSMKVDPYISNPVVSNTTTNLNDLVNASSISLNSGTLLATNSVAITAPISLSGSSVTLNSNGYKATYNGAITSTDNTKLVISDPTKTGTTTLNASNNIISGGVAVTGGTLAIGDANNPNASLVANVVVNNQATLIGHGTIAGAIFIDGVVRPGGSIGTLSLSGAYTQSSNGKLSIEVNPTQNSQLAISGSPGTANVAGSLELIATTGTYTPKKYTILTTTGGLSGKFDTVSTNLSGYSNLASAVNYDSNNVYYTIYPFTLSNVQDSIAATANALQSVYAIQSSALNAGLNYDCNISNSNQMCVSTGGRYTVVNTSENSTNALLIGSYRLSPNFRVGGFLDQNLSANQFSSGISYGNNRPMIGLFGVWSPEKDRVISVRVAVEYGDKDISITRPVINGTEPGTGTTRLNSQGASITSEYQIPVIRNLSFSPYIGLRYTKVAGSSYTEQSSSKVTAPLTVDALTQETSSALLGLKSNALIGQYTHVYGSLGIEQDINQHGGNYSASGIIGLSDINLSNSKKTRPTANLGLAYDLGKNQRVNLSYLYMQAPFSNIGSSSILLMYQMGL
ncbi:MULTISPECIES: autotransporter outer membrane beta-barrel domain-containing protein [unclassified Polynucleobacter]|uniref:autotransporter outer membrane beta-barrel domain-containing protein n=1 Tax=unclassified Polynucleobacter TaxID=2640945 RepID=UPI00248FB52C|nr:MULTISPECIES: autotransporter outer membrane beta-barrel domain-containing protein [unclassified Polynucleobacter]